MTDSPVDLAGQTFHDLLGELELEPTLRNLITWVSQESGATRVFLIVEKHEKYWIIASGTAGAERPVQVRFESLAAASDLSYNSVKHAMAHGDPIYLSDAGKVQDPDENEPFLAKSGTAILVLPLTFAGQVQGVFYLESADPNSRLDGAQAKQLKRDAATIAIVLRNALAHGALKRELADSKRRGKQAPDRSGSSQPGIIDYAEAVEFSKATGRLLHKLGNTLNSALLVGDELQDHVLETKLPKLTKAHELLESHFDEIETFLTQHEKGKLLPQFLLKVGHDLTSEHEDLIRIVDLLMRQLYQMRDMMRDHQHRDKAEPDNVGHHS